MYLLYETSCETAEIVDKILKSGSRTSNNDALLLGVVFLDLLLRQTYVNSLSQICAIRGWEKPAHDHRTNLFDLN